MKKVAALLALALAAVALVACGSDNGTTTNPTTNETGGEAAGGAAETGGKETGGGGGGGGGATVKFEADPGGTLAYTTTEASSEAGNVTLDFENPQPVPHDVSIEDSSGKTIGKTELITESSTSTSVSLKPGAYTFYCSVPGHREAGMEGTLTVK